MDAFLERLDVIHGNGDADEYLSILLRNGAPFPVALDTVWLEVHVTDAECQLVSSSDGFPDFRDYCGDELNGRFVIAVRARGSVPAFGSRLIGVHAYCWERCSAELDRITFRDPFLPVDLRLLDVARLSAEATVVFPLDLQRRRMRAPMAAMTTTRTATWKFRPTSQKPYHLNACQELRSDPPATILMDDALAVLHEVIARDACGELADVEEALWLLGRAYQASLLDLPTSVASLANLGSLPPAERQLRLRHALDDACRRSQASMLSPATSPAISPVASVGRKVRRPRGPKVELDVFFATFTALYTHWRDDVVESTHFSVGYILEELRDRGIDIHRSTLFRYLKRCKAAGLQVPAVDTDASA